MYAFAPKLGTGICAALLAALLQALPGVDTELLTVAHSVVAHVNEHEGHHVDPADALREAVHLLLVWRRVEPPADQQRYGECEGECDAAHGVAALSFASDPPSHDTIRSHEITLVVPTPRPFGIAARSGERLSPYTRVQAPLLV